MEKTIIPESVLKRYIDIYKKDPLKNMWKILKEAIDQENDFIAEMVLGETDRSKKARKILAENIYTQILLTEVTK